MSTTTAVPEHMLPILREALRYEIEGEADNLGIYSRNGRIAEHDAALHRIVALAGAYEDLMAVEPVCPSPAVSEAATVAQRLIQSRIADDHPSVDDARRLLGEYDALSALVTA